MALGAEVVGVDLRRIGTDHPGTAAVRQLLNRAWMEHLVLLFRGQSLDPEQLLAAARIFGEPEIPGAHQYYYDNGMTPPSSPHAAIMAITNLDDSGMPVAENDSLGSGEVVWHSDNSYKADPPSGSMLYSLELPPQGGNTAFSNQYLAYEKLPAALKAFVADKRAVHDSSRNSAGVLRPGLTAPTTLAEVPGPHHPLVRTHPTTGRKALYLGRRRAHPSQYIVGIDEAKSQEVLDELWSLACQPELVWEHQWRVGDVLIWDNRCTMHRRSPHDPRFPRQLLRIQLSGDEPR
jgi:taurine dioxygenase